MPMMQRELYALGSAIYEITEWNFPYAGISGEISDIAETVTTPVIWDSNIAPDIITRCSNFGYNSAGAIADDLAAICFSPDKLIVRKFSNRAGNLPTAAKPRSSIALGARTAAFTLSDMYETDSAPDHGSQSSTSKRDRSRGSVDRSSGKRRCVGDDVEHSEKNNEEDKDADCDAWSVAASAGDDLGKPEDLPNVDLDELDSVKP
ncbi:hypothetical protein G7046_g8418 [Stylonectria norvegica]|nr:hypothetical protein G7046_g8418 [Stylonectria norvegica]